MHAVLNGLQSSLELLEQNLPSFHGCYLWAHESDLVLPSGALGLTPEWAMPGIAPITPLLS